MGIHRTRKNKENPNYGFLVSWQPGKSDVKGESRLDKALVGTEAKGAKKADLLAQEAEGRSVKKDIVRSLMLVSLILILELVVYLAWSKFIS